jgi:hypothetical protein
LTKVPGSTSFRSRSQALDRIVVSSHVRGRTFSSDTGWGSPSDREHPARAVYRGSPHREPVSLASLRASSRNTKWAVIPPGYRRERSGRKVSEKVYCSELTPVSFLRRRAYMFPDKAAAVYSDRRYSYRGLEERVNRQRRARPLGQRTGSVRWRAPIACDVLRVDRVWTSVRRSLEWTC